jgi:uncharacterized membrane protein
MRRKNLDLIIMMSIVVMNVVWALLPFHITVIGIILALPLVFVLPGYALTEALFHQRSLETAHHLVFSLALSLAVVILSGFILNLFPTGLHALSWTLFLGLLTVVFSLIANLRRKEQSNGVQPLRFNFSISAFILFEVATIVTILAILYSAVGVAQQRQPGFTQLWIQPTAQSGSSCAIRIGVSSFESTLVTYRIIMTMNSTQIATWSSVALVPREQWEQIEPVNPGTSGNTFVEVRLYRLDKPQTVYQKVDLTLDNLGKGKGGQCNNVAHLPYSHPFSSNLQT